MQENCDWRIVKYYRIRNWEMLYLWHCRAQWQWWYITVSCLMVANVQLEVA